MMPAEATALRIVRKAAAPLVPTRYPCPLGEWCRVQWVSPEARDLWVPRLQAIGRAWAAAERASVGVIREACRQVVAPDELPDLSRQAAMAGLVLQVLGRTATPQAYQSAARAPAPGEAWSYQVALTTPGAAAVWARAWAAGDDETMGRLLGYPACCVAAYRSRWTEAGWRDLTWPQATATAGVALADDGATVRLRAAPTRETPPHLVEASVLLRWLGVRWVPHLPCSFGCRASWRLGRAFRGLMAEDSAGAAVVSWMDDVTDAPIRWSAWHGIAEMLTPICRVSASTDATAERIAVEWPGRRVPEAAATGIGFPYAGRRDEALWRENGFATAEAMDVAHTRLLVALAEADGPIVDLGAGNGYLVARSGRPGVGVEIDRSKIASAAARGWPVVWGDLADTTTLPAGPWRTALVSRARAADLGEAAWAALLAWCRAQADETIVYDYLTGEVTRWPKS